MSAGGRGGVSEGSGTRVGYLPGLGMRETEVPKLELK